MRLDGAQKSNSGFDLLGSEIRTRVACAFIPNPESQVSLRELSALIGKPQSSLDDAASLLYRRGLLEKDAPSDTSPKTYKRINHPLWAVYEAAKIAFDELGIELPSVIENADAEKQFRTASLRVVLNSWLRNISPDTWRSSVKNLTAYARE